VDTIEVKAQIAAAPSAVWSLLGDFGGVAAWNPFVESADINGVGVGMTRTITATGGARIVERLESLSAEDRHLRYSVQLQTGATSTADIRLEEGEGGSTVIVWQSIRDAQPSDAQTVTIVTTLRSRIRALEQALSSGKPLTKVDENP
jgi:hypothetical protein